MDDEAVAPAWFGIDERARWSAMKPATRAAFVASRRLLRRLLESATGTPASDWDVSARVGTAPEASRRSDASDGRGAVPRVSLAHRAGWVAAALAGDRAVGVDIECDRPPRSPASERAGLMLSAAELARWSTLPEPAREATLLRAWVAKEAWFKATPAGLAPWDFRRLEARPGAPDRANVRLWESPPVRVALCCDDAAALASAVCEAPAGVAFDATSFWQVARVD